MAQPVVRLTVNVTPEVAKMLDEITEHMGSTKTQALNQAIATTATLYKAEAEGDEAVVRNKSKNTSRKVKLPRKLAE